MNIKKLRNEVTYLLRTAEANYWQEKFANIKSSKHWRLVGKLTNKKVIDPITDDENNIILDDVVKTEARMITAIGPTLASKINSAEGFIDITHLY